MFRDCRILDDFLIPLQKYTNVEVFVYFCRGIWFMPTIRVIPSGIPNNIVESDKVLRQTNAKTIKLSRVPSIGEYIIWRNQNFQVIKVTFITENSIDAAIEIEWCESL
ncbi:hypothetical protein [Fischerella sp. PCC 9605]|uniref:hypothetical protein n=1 Tax=Fischerella sp. PCC 9605 TaxID=1173024 RepID=UPI000478F99E